MNNVNILVLCHWHDWHGKGFFCFQCLNCWAGQCGRNNCMLHNKFFLIGRCFQRNSDLSSPFLRFEWSNWKSKIQICLFLPCSGRKHIVKFFFSLIGNKVLLWLGTVIFTNNIKFGFLVYGCQMWSYVESHCQMHSTMLNVYLITGLHSHELLF